jgi:hypothetical protein
MPPNRRMMHKGVAFVIGPTDDPGLYRFQFQIGGKDIQGRVKTSLPGMAIRRARSAIDRRLRVQRAKSTTSCPRRMMHKGVAFAIEPTDVPGLYRFRFRIGRKHIQGRVKTSLPGMAIKRTRSAIDRRLRAQRAKSPNSRPRRRAVLTAAPRPKG